MGFRLFTDASRMLRVALWALGLAWAMVAWAEPAQPPVQPPVIDFGLPLPTGRWTQPLENLPETQGNPLTPAMALQAPGWRIWHPKGPQEFLGPQPSWLRLPLRNSADGPVTRWFQIDYWWLPDVRAQLLDDEGLPLGPVMVGGTAHPVRDRAVRAADPTFPVTLQAGQEAVLLIRAEGVVWWTDRLRLVDATEAVSSISRRTVTAAVLLGMSLVVALLMVARRSPAALVIGLWVLVTTLSELVYGGHLALLPWFDGLHADLNALSSSLVLLSHALQAAMTFLVLGLTGGDTWRRRVGVFLLLLCMGAAGLPWWTPPSMLQDVESIIYVSHAAGWLALAAAVWRGLTPDSRAIAAVLALLHLNWLVSYLDPHGIGSLLLSRPEVRISIKVALVTLLVLVHIWRDQLHLKKLQAMLTESRRLQTTALEQLVAQRTQQLHQALAEASQASQAKSQFISSMSHELRTPMNAILGFSQMLVDDKQLDARSREHAQEVLVAGGHLMVLIDDLLDLSKVELNRVNLTLEPVAVGPVAQACERLLAPKAMAQGVSLRLDNLARVVVHADEARLRQILLNLMDNAVKFNHTGGWVSVEALPGSSPGTWKLVVADGGPGVSADAQRRLFQPFERGDAQFGSVQGTGIGLALSRRLAEFMGGTMGLSSEPGAGSRFWLELKAVEPASALGIGDAGRTRAAGATVVSKLQRGHVVLCVDDNPINLKLMKRMLERDPQIDVVTCQDPQQAVDMAVEHRPSLVLMDINMPGLSGYDLLELLRQRPDLADVAVIAVSADAMRDDVARGQSAGFSDYVTKPLEIHAFTAVVMRTLTTVENGA